MNWQLNTIATDVQFYFIFISFTEFAMVIYKTKVGIVHIQCLLRIIDGSILTGVFLTSSFCVPESSGFQSNAASRSLFLHVELGTGTALVQLIALSQQFTASFKDLHTIGSRHW